MALEGTTGAALPGTPRFFGLSSEIRLRRYATDVRAGKQPDAALYFNETERAFLGQFQPAEPAGADPFAAFAGMFSGGGGGTTIGAPQIAPQPQLPRNVEEAKAYVREHYGMYAFLLDDPSIGPILEKAALEGWPDDRVQAELQGTDWWKNSTETTRRWDSLANTDPGQAKRLLEQATQSVTQLFARYGLKVKGNPRALEMAFNVVRGGWTEQEVRRAVVSELKWNPNTGVPNPLGNTTVAVTTLAADFGQSLAPSTAFDYAKQFEIGDVDEGMLTQRFRDQAKLTYTWWAGDLDAGANVRQLAEPYVQQYSQLLEVSPADVDLTDAKFQNVLAVNDTNGRRQRSLTEARSLMMSDAQYGWNTTSNAKEVAYGLRDQLAETLGAR